MYVSDYVVVGICLVVLCFEILWSDRFETNRTWALVLGPQVLFVSKRSDQNWRSDFDPWHIWFFVTLPFSGLWPHFGYGAFYPKNHFFGKFKCRDGPVHYSNPQGRHGTQLFEGVQLTCGNTHFCQESSKCHNYALFVGQIFKNALRIILGFGSNGPHSNKNSDSNVSLQI